MFSLTSKQASRTAVQLLTKSNTTFHAPSLQMGLLPKKQIEDLQNSQMICGSTYQPTSSLQHITGPTQPTQHHYLSRRLHTLIRHSSLSPAIPSTAEVYQAADRPVLQEGETMYSISIGDGDGSSPSIQLFDRSLQASDCCTVYMGVFAENETEVKDVRVSSYNSRSFTPYLPQSEHGTVVDNETMLNCSFVSDNSSNMTCMIVLKSLNDDVIGRSYLSIDHISHLGQEFIKLPIVNDNDNFVGTLDCCILEIHGIEQPAGGVDISQRQQCALSDRPLEIGHRGCGVTHTDRELFSSIPCLPENTIASLRMAHLHGADMVETDVVVTQDLKPVIHHDLEIDVSSDTLPISHVTSNVLEGLPHPKLDISPDQMSEQLFGDASTNTQHHVESLVTNNVNMFPSLRDLLDNLPSTLGLMLEVKTNIPEEGKKNVPYHDKNVYVDVILQELFRHAGSREIILCSFCPTTCIMFRNKQNRYPVVLITQGHTDTYPDYLDKRLQSLQTSAKLALSENLHGLSIFSGLLQENMRDTVNILRNAGLSTFTWGFHNCDKQYRQLSRDLGINGLVYDRIYEGNLPKRNFDIPKEEGHTKL